MASFVNRNPRKVKEMLASFIHTPEKATDSNSTQPRKPGSSPPEQKMTCNPGNREMFLERVQTFTSSKWAVKPEALSPLHCARYGWINDDNDHLVCVTCKASLYAGFPDEWDSNTYDEVCSTIHEKLKTGHDKLCPWQESPCPVSFLNLPCRSREEWNLFLRDSFEKLLTLGKDMPLLDEDVLDRMGIAERGVIQELLSIVNHQKTTDEQNLFARTAVALALCGWKASERINEDVTIICDTCVKECGLWNYVNVTEEITPSRSAKRLVPGQEGVNLNARSMYASFMSDMSTFRSSEFVSSNVSMHSETDSQMSENGANVFMQGASDSKRQSTAGASERDNRLEGRPASEAAGDVSAQDKSLLTAEEAAEENPEEVHQMMSDRIGRPPRRSSQESLNFKNIFTEPAAPFGKMELMKALLMAKDARFDPPYSESVISEVGSEAFEKRIELAREELSAEESNQDPDPPPPPPPNQEHLMKEILLVTAPHEGSPRGSESIFSEVGSLMFDKRLETTSICSPRAETPTYRERTFNSEEESTHKSNTLEGRVKRMRFHEPSLQTFNVVEEHRHWCPWIFEDEANSDESAKKSEPGWRRVLNSLLNADDRNDKLLQGSPDEVWKSVRRVLKDCQSPHTEQNQSNHTEKEQNQ